jgi:hypothetical protein
MMGGYAYDTSTLTIAITMPDGSTVEVVGDNDGVNGYSWTATLHSKPEGDPATVAMTQLPMTIDEQVLINGVEDTESINIEPDWDGMRRWVLTVFKTDPATACKIAAEMGAEAPVPLENTP